MTATEMDHTDIHYQGHAKPVEHDTIEKFVDPRTATGLEDFNSKISEKVGEDEVYAVRPKQHTRKSFYMISVTAHFMGVVALFSLPLFQWQTWIFNIFVFIWGGFGVCGGAHRLWSHRAYKARLPLRIILMLGCSIAGMTGYRIFNWAKDHRVHHRFTDTDGDPYNVKRGLFYSHFGWLVTTRLPEVEKNASKVDMTDSYNDPVVMFERKYHYQLLLLFCQILPVIIPMIYWNEAVILCWAAGHVRWMIQLNTIFSINSIAHAYGTRPYNKNITAAENLLVGVMAMGEGWHNYHHTFPWDYRNSELGWLDGTKLLVALSEKLGLAHGLKTASPELVLRVAARYGDGSHPRAVAGAPEIPEEAATDPSVVDRLAPPPWPRGAGVEQTVS